MSVRKPGPEPGLYRGIAFATPFALVIWVLIFMAWRAW